MVEHVNIIDTDRHEPKHASTAVINQSLVSNGDGTTQFRFYSYADLLAKPVSAGYRGVMTAFSLVNQNPAGLDTPLQVTFGGAQSNANVSMSALGTLTFLTAGDYAVGLILRQGRVAGGGTATLLTRFLFNGVQGLNSNVAVLPDATSTDPFSVTLFFTVVAGDTFKLEIMRDSSTANLGGLVTMTPVVGTWNPVPSATLVISKFTGLI